MLERRGRVGRIKSWTEESTTMVLEFSCYKIQKIGSKNIESAQQNLHKKLLEMEMAILQNSWWGWFKDDRGLKISPLAPGIPWMSIQSGSGAVQGNVSFFFLSPLCSHSTITIPTLHEI